MRLLGFPSSARAVGLDLGHSSVKIVEMEGNRLTRWAAVDLPGGAIQNGIIRDIAAVAGCVRRAAETAGLRGVTVHAAVSGAACVVRRLRLPALGPRDLAHAIRWEAERLLPYPFAEAVVDYRVLGRPPGPGDGQVDVVVAGVRTDVLNGYAAAIEGAGLRVGTMDIRPLARRRGCRGHLRTPGVLLVGVGAAFAELTAADDLGLLYTRTVPTGADAFDDQETREAREDLRRDHESWTQPDDEIARSIRFFESQTATTVAALAVTGGGAGDPRVVSTLRERTGLPVVLADPLAEIECEVTPPPPGPRLAAAVGLARRAGGAAADGAAMDLMRPALRPPRPKVAGTTVAAAAALIATLAVAALLAAIIIQSAQVARVAAGLDAQIAALQPQWTAVRQQALEIRRMRRETEAMEKILAAPAWAGLLESLRGAIPPGLWFTKMVADEGGAVEITVRTANPAAVEELLRRLRAAPRLRDVRLVTTEAVRVGEREVLQVQVAAQAVIP